MSLEEKIEELCASYPQNALKEAVLDLTRRYGSKGSHSTDVHRIAYLATRMPATLSVLEKVFSEIDVPPNVLDCGSGPGTSIWAFLDHKISSLTLIEKDEKFAALGKKIAPKAPFTVEWKTESFLNLKREADLILFSYSLNEIPEEYLMSVIEKAHALTSNYLVIVEPGTVEGFERIRAIREKLLKLGMFLRAPCPHHGKCPIKSPDWCHFSARVSRTSIHRVLKKGTLGHEDEKFSYLVASKEPFSPSGKRVLRAPLKRKGHTVTKLCTENGIEEKVFTGKERKNLSWGDLLI